MYTAQVFTDELHAAELVNGSVQFVHDGSVLRRVSISLLKALGLPGRALLWLILLLLLRHSAHTRFHQPNVTPTLTSSFHTHSNHSHQPLLPILTSPSTFTSSPTATLDFQRQVYLADYFAEQSTDVRNGQSVFYR